METADKPQDVHSSQPHIQHRHNHSTHSSSSPCPCPLSRPAAQLGSWFDDYLGKALSWCTSHPRAVETTRLGILNSALSHCALGPGSKLDFAAALARGMSCNMSDQTKADFLTDLSRGVCGARVSRVFCSGRCCSQPCTQRNEGCFPSVRGRVLEEMGQFNPSPVSVLIPCPHRLTGEVGLLDVGGGMDPLLCLGDELRDTPLGAEELSNLVVTVDVQQALATIAPWLRSHEPFILVGANMD